MACGFSGLQGFFYGGTGCFHRRKIIYGLQLDNIASINGKKINLKFHLPFLYKVNRKFIFNSFMWINFIGNTRNDKHKVSYVILYSFFFFVFKFFIASSTVYIF